MGVSVGGSVRRKPTLPPHTLPHTQTVRGSICGCVRGSVMYVNCMRCKKKRGSRPSSLITQHNVLLRRYGGIVVPGLHWFPWSTISVRSTVYSVC